MIDAVVGIDIGGTKMIVASEVNGKVVTKKYPTGIKADFKYIVNNYSMFIEEYNINPKALVVAIPGLINKDYVEECDVVPCLKGISSKDFSKEYKVCFINDVEAALIEEKKNYIGVGNLVVIMVGTGIGMSMLVDGKECQGASGFTGELGYSVVNTETGPTYLDNVSAGAGILKEYGDSAENLRIALDSGDEEAQNVIKKAGKYMGLGLISVISLLNPEVIVIGGGTSTYKNYFELTVDAVDKYSLPILRKPVKIVKETTLGLTVTYGALTKAKEILYK